MSFFNRNEKPGDAPQPKAQPAQPQANNAAPKPEPPRQVPAPILKPNAAPTPSAFTPTPTPASPPTPSFTSKAGAPMASVISKALKITGELESTEDIQIDGQIEGDVRGVGVKIGQNAKVKGTVYGDEVELAGTIEGRIESKKVILTGTARMTGDIVHQDIKIESGAYVSGNLKPELNKADSKPVSKPAVAAPSPVSATTAH
jgi:cytoskeletal protein CcmA (bactofilin family)